MYVLSVVMEPRLAYAAGRGSRNRGKAGFSDLSKVTQPDRDRVQVRIHYPEKLPGRALTQNSDKWQILTLS